MNLRWQQQIKGRAATAKTNSNEVSVQFSKCRTKCETVTKLQRETVAKPPQEELLPRRIKIIDAIMAPFPLKAIGKKAKLFAPFLVTLCFGLRFSCQTKAKHVQHWNFMSSLVGGPLLTFF
jgi:hypothetical protein